MDKVMDRKFVWIGGWMDGLVNGWVDDWMNNGELYFFPIFQVRKTVVLTPK